VDLRELLERYTVNEVKRQGEIVGQTRTRYRAWAFENFVVVVNEEHNSPVAVFDLAKGNRPLCIYDLDDAGKLMLAGAGVI
jgi:hypothetical protein